MLIKEIRMESEELSAHPFGSFHSGFIRRDNIRYILDVEYLINGLQVNAEVAIPGKELEGTPITREGFEEFLLERLFKEVTK